MYIVNWIAYADTKLEDRKIIQATVLSDMIMILTFQSDEKRLFDSSSLLKMPAFNKLSNPEVFSMPSIDHGVVTWDDGKIDIDPETMYKNSYQYS